MTEYGIYQNFNAGKLLKRINQPKGSSDYHILIKEKEMNIKIDIEERNITYINQEICQQNLENIKEAIIKDQQPNIQNPLKNKTPLTSARHNEL